MGILELRSVASGYSGKEVVSDISFVLEEGGFLGIIGPNGAGKTTLFRTITKIIEPMRGTVLFSGRDIGGIKRHELAREVSAMLPLYDLPFSYSVLDFVMMGRFPHQKRFGLPSKKDLEITRKSLELTDAWHLSGRRLHEISGGERQRVILAQALAQEPRLLLLDEPTAYLDLGHQIAILDVIKKLNRENGLSIITILHDLNLAGEYCSRILMLNGGKIFMEGTPHEVLKYQNIEQVYKTVVIVKNNPISSKPYVIAVSKEELNKNINSAR
ncbi:MAG: ABC transporter ATP-binding protein [Elusimicrobia bacterium]|nr:ABC transporter ATP-binding protein [Elusimicrobiota bacterium]